MLGLFCWSGGLAAAFVMAVPHGSPTSLNLQEKNVVIQVTGNSSESSPSPTMLAGSSANNSNSSGSTGNATSTPYYTLDLKEPPENSKSLQYLYLIFLVFVVIIGGLLLRWCVIKRRRARKVRRRNLLRTGALQMDLDRARQSAETLTSNSLEPAMSEMFYFGDDDPRMPPPSYPEAAILKNSRLPIYDEVSDSHSAFYLSSSTAVSPSSGSEPDSASVEHGNSHDTDNRHSGFF